MKLHWWHHIDDIVLQGDSLAVLIYNTQILTKGLRKRDESLSHTSCKTPLLQSNSWKVFGESRAIIIPDFAKKQLLTVSVSTVIFRSFWVLESTYSSFINVKSQMRDLPSSNMFCVPFLCNKAFLWKACSDLVLIQSLSFCMPGILALQNICSLERSAEDGVVMWLWTIDPEDV